MNANFRESEKLWTGFIWLRIHTSGYAKVNDPRYISDVSSAIRRYKIIANAPWFLCHVYIF
jgi:hypothetical protein